MTRYDPTHVHDGEWCAACVEHGRAAPHIGCMFAHEHRYPECYDEAFAPPSDPAAPHAGSCAMVNWSREATPIPECDCHPSDPAAPLDVDGLIRNIEERIDRAAMGASVGQLSGSPVSEAIAWELGSLLVDITEQRGMGTVDWYASGGDGETPVRMIPEAE